MEISTHYKVLKLNDRDSRLEVYVTVNGEEMTNPTVVIAGPSLDVQEFADGKISWPELRTRWNFGPK